MKKILLSLLMLCTAISAWSYETETVTITCGGTNNSPFTVSATIGSAGMTGDTYWEIRNGYSLKLKAKQGYYITKVEFVQTGDNVESWDKLQKYTPKSWVRPSDDTAFYDVITFSNEYNFSKVTSITVTYYHVCYGATHHDAIGGTCTAKGQAEYWECICGKIYSNADCTNEVTAMAQLATQTDPTNHSTTLNKVEALPATCVSKGSMEHWFCNDCQHCFSDQQGKSPIPGDNIATEINPTNHKAALTKTEATPATCVSTGNVAYWQCNDCNHRFEDEAGQKAIAGDNVATDIDPTNHNGKLKEVAHKNASVIEEGTLHHWHCEACGNDYADADCTKDITGKTAKAKYDADALLVGNTTVDESYLLGEGATVTFDGNNILLNVNGNVHEYALSDQEYIGIDFAHTFKLKANQDPDHTDRYYSTFFTSEGAYRVKADETATAYTGTIEDGEEEGFDILNLTAVEGVIPSGEAVIVRGSEKNITLMPSCKTLSPSAGNILEGTDESTTLGAGQYALSLGQNGVGLYLWNGKTIGANKAYLTLDEEMGVKALTFRFNDEPGPTGIDSVNENENENLYDLRGLRVSDGYKGIVIKNGKKVIR